MNRNLILVVSFICLPLFGEIGLCQNLVRSVEQDLSATADATTNGDYLYLNNSVGTVSDLVFLFPALTPGGPTPPPTPRACTAYYLQLLLSSNVPSPLNVDVYQTSSTTWTEGSVTAASQEIAADTLIASTTFSGTSGNQVNISMSSALDICTTNVNPPSKMSVRVRLTSSSSVTFYSRSGTPSPTRPRIGALLVPATPAPTPIPSPMTPAPTPGPFNTIAPTPSNPGPTPSNPGPTPSTNSNPTPASSDTTSIPTPTTEPETTSENTGAGQTFSSSAASNVGMIAGIAVAAAVILIVICVIIVFVVIRKRRNNNGGEPKGTKSNELGLLSVPSDPFAPVPIELLKDGSKLKAVKSKSEEGARKERKVDVEFDAINNKSPPADPALASVALLPQNKLKNRYNNVVPFDNNRVVLRGPNDYINASFLSGYQNPKRYIAAQGPLDSTVNDFWEMIWQENVSVVVMMTRLIEEGKAKCAMYWPKELQKPLALTNYEITMTDEEVTKEITNRQLTVRKHGENDSRTIWHLHYTEWPDHGIPTAATSFLKLVHLSDEHNLSKGPIVAHCSAGLGRTGTFVLVHSILEKAKKDKSFTSVSIPNELLNYRKERSALVQSVEQLEFIYVVLSSGLSKDLEQIPDLKKIVPPPDANRHYQKFDVAAERKAQQHYKSFESVQNQIK